MSSPCSFIFMQIKVIFITMVSHLDSLWHRGTRELGNGLLCPWKDKKKWTDATQELEFIITPLTTYRHEKNITVRLFSILLQVIAFESNPFLWDVTSENVTSDVLDISMKTNGSYVHFSQLEKPFELFIPLKKQKKQGTDDTFFVKWSNSFENIRYHKIIIPSDGAVAIIDIVPVENNFLDIFISADPGLLHWTTPIMRMCPIIQIAERWLLEMTLSSAVPYRPLDCSYRVVWLVH